MLREVTHRVEKVGTQLLISRAFLAEFAPLALRILQEFGSWQTTNEDHTLWQAIKSGVEGTVMRLSELQGKNIVSIHLAEMRIASPHTLLLEGMTEHTDKFALFIWMRVEVGD